MKQHKGKWAVRRHGGGKSGKSRRLRADRAERLLERRVRRDGKVACQEGEEEARRR